MTDLQDKTLADIMNIKPITAQSIEQGYINGLWFFDGITHFFKSLQFNERFRFRLYT